MAEAEASEPEQNSDQLAVAFLGNSILYYNDCPRVLEALSDGKLKQDSCLRGGASLEGLIKNGNGMGVKHWPKEDCGQPTVDALLESQSWNFVVMHDYTQRPARLESRNKGVKSLKKEYVSRLKKCGAIPVLMQTVAYRSHSKGSEDLGNPEEFTQKLVEGYNAYADALREDLPKEQDPIIAPNALAFLRVHDERPDLWKELYCDDNYHPAPKGTLLQACVLYCTLFKQSPPSKMLEDPIKLFSNSRKIWDKFPMPTKEDASYFAEVATKVVLTSPKL